jgi:hypothetical protein
VRARTRECGAAGGVRACVQAVCGPVCRRYPHRLRVLLLVFSIKLSSLKGFEE